MASDLLAFFGTMPSATPSIASDYRRQALRPADHAKPVTDPRRVLLPGWTVRGVGLCGLAAAYYVSGRLGLLLAIPPGYATAVWPPAGFALAGILLYGYRVWPAIVLASFFLNVGTSLDPATAATPLTSIGVAVTIALGATAQAALGALLIERTVRDREALVVEEDIIKFLLLGGPVSCLVSATVGVTALTLGGLIPTANAPLNWCTWWVGDSIGAILFTPLVLAWMVKSPAMTRRRRLSITLPTLAMFVIAVVLFAYASSWEQERLVRDFERRAEGLAVTLRKSFDGYLEALQATRRLFASTTSVDREVFRNFTERTVSRTPGIRAVSWSPRITANKRVAFEEAIRREGFAGFQITEPNPNGRLIRAGDRAEYVVVDYIEPYPANAGVLGLDAWANSVSRETLIRARDTGQPVATPPVKLWQEPVSRPGFAVVLSVYQSGARPQTVEERRASVRGYVAGVFQIAEIMSASLKGVAREGIDLEVFDESDGEAGRLIYQKLLAGGFDPRPAALTKRVPFDVAGRRWTLALSISADYAVANRSLQAWTVLASGVLFTALFGAFLLVLTGRTALVEGLVRERTAALASEVAERTRAAVALHQSEERFRSLSTASPVGIFQSDPTGRYLYTNPRWQQMTGLTLEQSLGTGWLRSVHADDRNQVAAEWSNASREARPFSRELRFHAPQGEVRWVHAQAEPILAADGTLLGHVGTTDDVTERRRTEQVLRDSEELYRLLAEGSSDFISRQRVNGMMTYASPACRTLLGYEPEELVGRVTYEFFYPADVEPVRKRIQAAIDTGEVNRVSYRMRRKDGEFLWLETTLRFVKDPATGAASEVVAVSRDVSEGKRLERMRQDLVLMLSHDIKNPLTAVIGFAEILHELPPEDPQRQGFLTRIEANAQSALTLAINFVDASQIESGSLEPKLEPVSLNEIVEHVLGQQESRARVKQIRLETRLDRSLATSPLDRRLIDRVIANLVNNAIKFSPDTGRVVVETSSSDGRVTARVSDQGPGIPVEERSNLFQRFSRATGRRPDSSGLGLFIVKTLVDAQGGIVTVDFPPQGGSVFEVSFPRA